MTTTTIHISDIGSSATCSITDGVLTVKHDGGGPVGEILAGLRTTRPVAAIARTVLRRWLRGYDGDPSRDGNSLSIEVTRDEEIARVEA